MHEPDTITNPRRLDGRVTTSGRPTMAQLADSAGLGVRHVINLGLHSHERALPDEAAAVAGLGMAYLRRPVDCAAPTDAHFDAFRAAYEGTGSDPVHGHRIFSGRVSAFLYRYRRDVLGGADAAARADMDPIWTLHGAWVDFVHGAWVDFAAPRPAAG